MARRSPRWSAETWSSDDRGRETTSSPSGRSRREPSQVESLLETHDSPGGRASYVLGLVVDQAAERVAVLAVAAGAEGARGARPHPGQLVGGQPCRGVAAGQLPGGRDLEAHLG